MFVFVYNNQMGSEREKNYDYNNQKKKSKRVNKRNAAVKGKHKPKKKLKTKVSSYEKAVQKFNESRQLSNSNTITNKRITTGRLKPEQSQVGMFLKGLRAPFVRRDSLTEARRNEDINKIIDIGGKSRKREIFVKHNKYIQDDNVLNSLGLNERESEKPERIQDIVSNTIRFRKSSSPCSCEDETMRLTERNRRIPKGRLPDSGLRRSRLEEYCANPTLTQLNCSKSSDNSSNGLSILKGIREKDLGDSFSSLPNLGMSSNHHNPDDMSFMNCCDSQKGNDLGKRIRLDESQDLNFGPLSPLDKCTLSPINFSFPFRDQTEELINVKELAKEIPTAHFKSGRRKDDEKQTKTSESEERLDSIKESEEFALKYEETVASGTHPAVAPSGGTIQNTINSLKQMYISNLEKIKTKKQESPPDIMQFNDEPREIIPKNEFFISEDVEKSKPTPFLNGFEFITRKSENLIDEDIFPDPILLSQEILPEMEFPDLIITPESGEPQINAKTVGTDCQSRKSHLQIVIPNRQFSRRNMF